MRNTLRRHRSASTQPIELALGRYKPQRKTPGGTLSLHTQVVAVVRKFRLLGEAARLQVEAVTTA